MKYQPLGYLMVDHRASPGLPADVARKLGYLPELCAEGKLFESDTLTCTHCKCVVIKNPDRLRARANCVACGNQYICDLCAAKAREPDYVHAPFEAVVELHLRQAALGSPAELLIPAQPQGTNEDG